MQCETNSLGYLESLVIAAPVEHDIVISLHCFISLSKRDAYNQVASQKLDDDLVGRYARLFLKDNIIANIVISTYINSQILFSNIPKQND